ncbi:hypothetical protein CIW50_25705 [Tardiphaga sp. P9-11]|nr:hypothetical protein CIW50_25705 [Tardiphaga sp. P9-11]
MVNQNVACAGSASLHTRQARPDLRVLLTSGYALETLTAHGRLRDGSVILAKPYRKAELAGRLREVLKVALCNG